MTIHKVSLSLQARITQTLLRSLEVALKDRGRIVLTIRRVQSPEIVVSASRQPLTLSW